MQFATSHQAEGYGDDGSELSAVQIRPPLSPCEFERFERQVRGYAGHIGNTLLSLGVGVDVKFPSRYMGQVRMTMLCIMTAFSLLVPAILLPFDAQAQEIDFDQINKFESVGKGTLNVGEPPKTIVDDNERHVVILTIWDADAETKVFWKSPEADTPRTTVIPGRGIQTFQTAGEFKLEAIGEPNRKVEFGYVLLGLRK